MDVVRTRRQATRANNPIPNERTGMLEQNAQTSMEISTNDTNGMTKQIEESGSSKTPNLISTENRSTPSSGNGMNGATTSNGKSNNSKYIPPVQSRDHNTRSRNGIRKEVQYRSESPLEQVVQPNATKMMLAEAADQLARIDETAYRREQMRDANEVLSQLVLPMSLPWTHRVSAYRIVSRDIDELEGILDSEEAFPGEDRIGALGEAETCTLPQHHVLAARRSSHDPGIVDFVRFRVPRLVDYTTEASTASDVEFSLAGIEENTSLGFGEVVQRRKRRRVQMIENATERITVSLCFGGTSSRSSLRPRDASFGVPFVLEAKLPNEISGGRRMEPSQALEEATYLGSYDHRHGQPRLSDSTKRVRTGRTRTVWSSKESLSQRPVHKSLLTGSILENGRQRRPAEVKVFIRLNGRLMCLDKKHTRKVLNGDDDDEWAASGYTDLMVETSLQMADNDELISTARENLQCSFETEDFFGCIKKRNSTANQFVKRIREPYFVQVVEKDGLWLSIRPPVLWSNPCEDGVFQVVCTQAGELKGIQFNHAISTGEPSGKNYPWATAIFLDEMAKQHQTCCICWSEPKEEDEQDLIICTSCEVRVHSKCYRGKSAFDSNWVCDSCLDYQERATALPASLTPRNVRWARKCGLCDQFGSDMSLCPSIGGNQGSQSWVHATCRMWDCARAFEEGECVLCSSSSRFLVRCAATGCSLKFHPMCAVISSHAVAIGRSMDHTYLGGAIEGEEDRDIFLSTQFCQEVATVAYGKKKMKRRTIPVAYCGLHNPQRAPDRRGLLPAAVFFNEAVHLPLQRTETHT